MKWTPVLLFFSFLICFQSHAQLIDRIVAIVGDEIITLSDLRKFKKTLNSGGMYDDRLLLGKARESIVSDSKELLEALINERILQLEIRKNGLEAPIEKVEQEIRTIAKRNGLTVDQMMQAITSQGMNVKEYRNFLRSSIERQSLLEKEILTKIKITDEDVATYFSRNSRLAKSKIFEYTIAHILFDPRRGGEEQARERAMTVYTKLKKGEPFDALANRYTEESNASAGGVLGTFKSGELSKEFENAVSGLEVGAFSQVIRSQNGLHIFKLVNRGLITDPAYEREKMQAQAVLQEREFKRLLKDWLERRRQDLFVRLNTK